MLFSTFVGGDSQETGISILLDYENNAYITGRTWSSDFPTSSGCFDDSYNGGDGDVFVFKLKYDGSDLLYSTFIGGSDVEVAESVALDSENNAYITGGTSSFDFPTTSGCFDDSYNGYDDVFVFKLNSNGSSLIYSTFIGGSKGDSGKSIALDFKNNTYITGLTASSNFPTTSGCFDDSHNGNKDAFIFKLNLDGSDSLFSTYAGGGDGDFSDSITIDSENNTYITGATYSSDFPTTSGCYDDSHNGDRDVFVFKLKSDGSDSLYSTFVGGNSVDRGWGISLDSENNACITGYTWSLDFPTTKDCFNSSHNGESDVFVCKLSFNLTLTVSDK